ncbi:hypothetical protein X971_0908 [Agrobacterium tumefaciens LBA4213 (Ach5)]|nr:hypothetical protein X971_0908 [Agrobacterium tumefaciens LBA4213 (Ach5)]
MFLRFIQFRTQNHDMVLLELLDAAASRGSMTLCHSPKC